MELVTNIASNSHKDAICELISKSDVCILCTSFFDINGLNLIMPSIKLGIKENDLKIKIFSNGESGYTKPSVVKKLNSMSEVEHKVFKLKGRRLHSKLYYFEKDGCFEAILGSANLTINGLTKNEELSIKLSGELNSPEHTNIKGYLNNLEASWD